MSIGSAPTDPLVGGMTSDNFGTDSSGGYGEVFSTEHQSSQPTTTEGSTETPQETPYQGIFEDPRVQSYIDGQSEYSQPHQEYAPPSAYEQRLQLLEQEQARQDYEVQIHLAYLQGINPALAQELAARHQQASFQRQVEYSRLQSAMDRASMEEPAKQVAIHNIVQEIKRYVPHINVTEAEARIASYPDGRSMMRAAKDFIAEAKKHHLQQRSVQGIDRIGGEGSSTASFDMKSRDTMALLTQGYKQGEQRRQRDGSGRYR